MLGIEPATSVAEVKNNVYTLCYTCEAIYFLTGK